MMFLAVATKASAKTLYLNTGGSSLWEKDGANKFAVWHWQGVNAGSWSGWMTKVEGNVWKTDIADGSDNVIFCRFNTSVSSPNWENQIWNKTEDLSIPSGKNLYTITGWDASAGEWFKYGDEGGSQGGNPDPVVPTDYATAVPSECQDVMLQGFYWNSNVDKGFGDTQWNTLSGQAEEIGRSFDLIWLPPSAQASGISQGGLGYIPLKYSLQSCQMGKIAAFNNLMSALHTNGVRVIADIVINHIGNPQGNCSLEQENFGSYGNFTPTKDWLTKDDEGGCGSNGNYDDGQNGQWRNFESARDWDHKNTNVQNMCKAYLKWLRGEVKYDGFRYDYAGGFHVSHINDYNTAAKPYLSVMEYWDDGNVGVVKTRIDEAGKNTMAFDFPGRMTAFKNGIAKSNYNNCKNAGLRGQGYSKYAVTFVDNHDTFNRAANNVTDVCDKGDGSSINNESVILQCNAYMLSMPGVPCVFWPHWVRYKSAIQKMIHARKMAGIHSESSVQEESGSGYYRATIQGKYGSVKLMLGSAASDAHPQDYTLAIKGSTYAVYYKGSGNAIDNVEVEPLDVTKPMFTVMGQQVDESYRGIVIQNGHKYILQ